MAKYKTFINPSGIIEHCYYGNQSPEATLESLKKLEKIIKQLEKQNKPVLVLADVSQIPKIDMSSRTKPVRQQAITLMRSAKIKRAAVYGPLKIQLIVNTLALIAGKQDKIRVFRDRIEALRWLKEKTKT